MATCRTCAYLRKCIDKATGEGYEHNVDFDPKDGCTGIGYKSNTNADRIRAMSDEELAEVLGKLVHCGGCPMRDNCKIENLPCSNELLKWLKQPVEEE